MAFFSFYVPRRNPYQTLSPVSRIVLPLILMIMPFFFASIITCIVTLAIVVVFLMLAQVPFRAVKPFTSIF